MWRVDFFFKISKLDFTFIREMRVHSLTFRQLQRNLTCHCNGCRPRPVFTFPEFVQKQLLSHLLCLIYLISHYVRIRDWVHYLHRKTEFYEPHINDRLVREEVGSNFTATNTSPFDYFDNEMCGKKVGRKDRP